MPLFYHFSSLSCYIIIYILYAAVLILYAAILNCIFVVMHYHVNNMYMYTYIYILFHPSLCLPPVGDHIF